MTALALAVLMLLSPRPAHAWGMIGHRMIAETAALLIGSERPDWGGVFSRHRFHLGYYSIVPDTRFRFMDPKNEPARHFFDLDAALASGVKLDELVKTKKRCSLELGSSPWRIEELFKLAQTKLSSVSSVQGTFKARKELSGSEKNLFDGFELLGLLAHYTGDAAMPLHASKDWDAKKTGNDGIHFFFESDCVDQLESVLLPRVRKRAENLFKSTPAGDPFAQSISVFQSSLASIPELVRLDHEKILSHVKKRNSSFCAVFEDLLTERLATGAALTARLWVEALPQVFLSEGKQGPVFFAELDESPAIP